MLVGFGAKNVGVSDKKMKNNEINHALVSRSAVAPDDWRRAAESHEGRLAAATWSGGLVCDRIRALLLIHQIDVICTHAHTNALGSENGGRGEEEEEKKEGDINLKKREKKSQRFPHAKLGGAPNANSLSCKVSHDARGGAPLSPAESR